MRTLLVVALAACGSKSKPELVQTRAGDIVIADVTVVPMDRDGGVAHQTVIVRGDKIVAVADEARVEIDKGATRIDGTGRWLMPGLADMHVHTWNEADLTMFVAAGVTTVRNMYGADLHLAWRDEIKAGKRFGPTIVTASPILDGDPPVWPGSIVLAKPDEVDGIVAGLKGKGYDFLKPYARLEAPVYAALAAAGKKHGLTLQGHVPKAVGLEAAIASGQRSVEHLDGWFAALAVKAEESAPPNQSFWKQTAALLPRIDEAKLPVVAERMKKAGAYNCPTLIVMSRMAALEDVPALEKQVKWLKLVTPEVIATWNPKQDFRLQTADAEDYKSMRDANAMRKKIVRALATSNAPVIVGTDTGNPYVLPGEAMHDEIELLVDAGMPRPQVMRAATAGAQVFLGAPANAVLAAGARADLLLVTVDPMTQALPLVPEGIVLHGTWIPKTELEAKLAAIATKPSADRFAGVPALVPDGADPKSTRWEMTSGDKVVGEERLAAGDGGKLIVAQSVMDVPGRIEARYRIAPTGTSVEQKSAFGTIVMDGKLDGGNLVVTGKDARGDKIDLKAPLPAGGFIAGPGIGGSFGLVALVDKLAVGAKRTAESLELATFPNPMIQRAKYAIERKPDANGHRVFDVSIDYGNMKLASELVLDNDGIVSQKFGPPLDVVISRR